MGRAKNQYFFKEYGDGTFMVATTTWSPIGDEISLDRKGMIETLNKSPGENTTEAKGRNHLWALQQDGEELQVVKVEKNFGEPNEDIRSVRYTNEFAYIVTFEKTDPLFTFDMKIQGLLTFQPF